MTVKIDVVIPTRDRNRRVARVVVPLLEDPAVSRLILVNDAPGESESLRTMSPELPEGVEVICTGGVGPAEARQAGAARSTAEVLLFIDDDVIPEPGLASRHARHHQRGARLLVCGYTPVVPVAEDGLSAEAFVYAQSYEERCLEYDRDSQIVLTHLWGGNFSLRRADALAIGLASPEFAEMYHEDRDFGLRCLEAGLSSCFDREIKGAHEYEREWSAVASESFSRGYSTVLIHRLHGSVVGPVDEQHFERGLPTPLRAIVKLSARPQGSRIVVGITHGFRRLGGYLRLWQLQLASVRLLRRIRGAAGIRAALRTPPMGEKSE